jgi:mono/diheme cytochrome c family protein
MSVSIRAALGWTALAACGAVLAAAGPGLAQAPGAYTADQAARGAQTFTDKCSGCHGVDYTGGGGSPSLKGPEFMYNWNGKTAADLFAYVHDNMPPGEAGSLSDAQYTEIVAAILNANGLPAGATPLPAGAASAGVVIKP